MKKILVIEDELSIKKGIQAILELRGYKVFTASDGTEGIALAAELKPDLILCDIMMPETDGYEVIKVLSSNPATSRIPFIFITAKASRDDLRTGMQLGADDYITKPFKSDELIQAVEVRLNKFDLISGQESSVTHKKTEQLQIEDTHLVGSAGKLELIEIKKIVLIEAVGNYSKIHTPYKNIIIRRTLSAWDKMLPQNHFIRIHRGFIINIGFIETISKWSSSTYRIKLKTINEPLHSSQRYSKHIRKYLK